MSYDKWYKANKEHLIKFKKEELRITEPGIYKPENYYDHILPEGEENKNFIREEWASKCKHHCYYHHLNSSQTMCVNFFMPLIEKPELLQEFLHRFCGTDAEIVRTDFEYVNAQYGNTNFDFHCLDSKGNQFFFEIKYTERGFEKKCRSKHSLSKVYNTKYKRLVEQEGSYIKAEQYNEHIFMTQHYQILRNMCVANSKENRYCIFITMNGNEATKRHLEPFANAGSHIKFLYWETDIRPFIEEIKSELAYEGDNPYDVFIKKYFLDE